MYCNGCGAPLDGPKNFCPSCGRPLVRGGESARASVTRPPDTGSRRLDRDILLTKPKTLLTQVLIVLAVTVVIVLSLATLAKVPSKQQSSPAAEVPPPSTQRVETQAPRPTPEESEQNRLAQAREVWTTQLRLKLRDGGFDITVGTVGDALLLSGDIFKDTETRVETLQTIRAMPGICDLGFRKVNIAAGLFSGGSDYSAIVYLTQGMLRPYNCFSGSLLYCFLRFGISGV